MKRKQKRLKLVSFITQGVYSFLCVLNIIIGILYFYNFDTAFGKKCSDVVLALSSVLFLELIPFVLISLICYLFARPDKQAEKKERVVRIAWMIASPCLYFVCFFISIVVAIMLTGGV